MMLVIRTQVLENYAAHQGFTGEYYWKAKGGSEYKILNVPTGVDYAEVVYTADVEQNNNYFQETIVEWTIETDDYLSWFEKSQLEYDGEITYKEPTIEYSDLWANAAVKEYEDRQYAEKIACEGY